MSYQVLARKWRPRIFREMVGQEHVLRALINALDHNRLHHAYLFTGTRGVGKTTIARILAKCLNCEQGVSSEPCGQCGACVEIAEGRFVDLIEVDAASKTKVEDTRELLDNVQYAPTRGRYKVYLIDEVHMLSNSSFNALLKTLEEPPPHVKFLLATTDPQKLPVTVLSRCLQFNLKNMNPERIVGHLQFILDKEMVPFEEPALWQLGRAADGSMRDALSLTDQAIAFGSGKVHEAEVRSMLGTLDQSHIVSICQALAAGDGSQALQVVAQMSEQAPDYDSALAELLALLHRIAIGQAVPDAVDNSAGDRDQVLALAQQMAAEDVQLFYQTALLARRDLPLSPDPRGGFEMAVLRMLAFKPQGVPKVPNKPLANSGPAVAPPATPTPVTDNSVAASPAAPATAAPTPAVEIPPPAEPIPIVEPAPVATNMEASVDTAPAGPTPTVSASEVPVEPAQPIEAPHQDAPAVPEAAMQTQAMPHSQPAAIENQVVAPETSAVAEVHALAQSAPTIEAQAQPAAQISEPQTVVQTAAEPELSNSELVDIRGLAQEVVDTLKPESELAAEPEAQPVTIAPVQPIAYEALDPDNWFDLYRQLDFSGVLQATASNCALVQRQENGLAFVLDESNNHLYDIAHQQRMADIFSEYFGRPLQVQIVQGNAGDVTPASIIARLKAQRQAEALAAIETDPTIIQLIEEFDAKLITDSVVPLGPDPLKA
ncbi:DNA polymerase III subunit gamma/tau [Pseudoteredinibacter isoporae]|uniref:DNA polymerase III subunit gamma/tau n=1 Tax=Pseudoteredinibacter isoporae TaxID=570281 RepID=A0A7X0MYQ0_9GAMM|nr:DNA polymerase III subunit gamma/tau [Pseudoteredinibacter isoporae]MBB6523324.1 DNA polymerase-3 subunit gamma/tau [Pseudoteredinibacter isoporae]NHO88838.1 DNA polymerase III subunit gamma/tau [Pseudoteredinibacter isoporae]NIB24454.1 DNA polymerase III subunit gamma/tau [Pseudoteredinibacter isoporae]